MKTLGFWCRRLRAGASATVAAALGLWLPLAADVAYGQSVPLRYDEAVLGDIVSRVGDAPLFQLGVGENVVSGSIFSRIVVADLVDPLNTVVDFDPDYFVFEVPAGTELAAMSIEWSNGVVFPAGTTGGISFCRIADSQWSFPPLVAFGSTRDRCAPITATSAAGRRDLFESFLPLAAGTYVWWHGVGITICEGCRWSTDYSLAMEVVRLDPAAVVGGAADLVDGAELPAGMKNSLASQLDAALSALARGTPGSDAAAAGVLRAFIHSVEAKRGESLSDELADALVSAAQSALAALALG